MPHSPSANDFHEGRCGFPAVSVCFERCFRAFLTYLEELFHERMVAGVVAAVRLLGIVLDLNGGGGPGDVSRLLN